MTLLVTTPKEQFVLDPISSVLITMQMLINIYMALAYIEIDIYVTVASIVFALMTVGGLGLHAALCGGIRFDKTISTKEATGIWTHIILGIVLVAVAQIVAFRYTPSLVAFVTALERKLFYFSGAIAEETMIRYYVQSKAHYSLKNLASTPYKLFIVAGIVIGVSLLFMSWHFAVYSTDLIGLYAVFGGSIGLSSIYYRNKRLGTVQMIHAWTNFLAS